MIDIIGKITGEIGQTIRHVVKDPNEANKLSHDIASKLAEGDLARDLGALAINKIDAQSKDKFQSRWRPSIGWICAIGLAHEFIIFPWFVAIVKIWKPEYTLPNIPFAELTIVLGAMLGVTGSRSWEKFKGLTR